MSPARGLLPRGRLARRETSLRLGPAYVHILPEYSRRIRYARSSSASRLDEPNDTSSCPTRRRETSGTRTGSAATPGGPSAGAACGYCAGSRLWRWEPNCARRCRCDRSARRPDPQAAGDHRLAEARPRRGPHLRHGRLRRVEEGRYATAALADEAPPPSFTSPPPAPSPSTPASSPARPRPSWFDPTDCERGPPSAAPRGTARPNGPPTTTPPANRTGPGPAHGMATANTNTNTRLTHHRRKTRKTRKTPKNTIKLLFACNKKTDGRSRPARGHANSLVPTVFFPCLPVFSVVRSPYSMVPTPSAPPRFPWSPVPPLDNRQRTRV